MEEASIWKGIPKDVILTLLFNGQWKCTMYRPALPGSDCHLGQNPSQNAILAYQLLLLNLSMVPTSFAASTSQLYYMMWQNVDFGDPNRIAIGCHRTGNTCQYPRPAVGKYYIHIEANEANSRIGATISENIHQKGVKISNYFVYPQCSFCTPNQCIRI